MDKLKWIEIDLGAIRRNLRWILSRLGPSTRLMAVVKADAYGHGAEAVARAAASEGAACLGVLTVEEALALRRAGIGQPIVLLSPPLPSQARAVVGARLEATVDSWALAAALGRAASPGRPARLHVDLDSGLRRWGLAPKALPAFLAKLRRRRSLTLAGVSTHIDYVPGKNAVEAEAKLRAFHRIATRTKQAFPAVIAHAANTSILMDFPQWGMDMARVGNLLYGINPAATPAPLKNPWAFKARVISLAVVRKGIAVGYGSEYIAPRRMLVGALPVGYSDGLTMEPAERFISFGRGFQYWGMLRGRPAPFIGRCGISHVLVDLSRAGKVSVGDAVTLPIRRTAAGARLPRVYL